MFARSQKRAEHRERMIAMLMIQPENRPIFLTQRGDRLAARLKNMLYAWRFSRQVDGQVIIGWLPRERTIYNALPAEPYSPMLIWDLPRFYADGWSREIFFMEGDNRTRDEFESLEGPNFADVAPNNFRKSQFVGRHAVYQQGAHMVYQFEGETREGVEAEVRALFRTLPLSSKVTALLNRAQSKLGSEDYVALHVRRGDIIEVLKNARNEMESGTLSNQALAYVNHFATRTAPLSFYYASVERAIAGGQKIVFFSDTPETYTHFVGRYGSRAIIDGTSLAKNAPYPLQAALIDFLLIGGSKRVISTGTGYATIAAQLCGAQLESVSAGGPSEALLSDLFDNVLGGARLDGEVRKVMTDAVLRQYEVYHPRWLRQQGTVQAAT